MKLERQTAQSRDDDFLKAATEEARENSGRDMMIFSRSDDGCGAPVPISSMGMDCRRGDGDEGEEEGDDGEDEEGDLKREIRRRRRWIDAEAAITRAIMPMMMRTLGVPEWLSLSPEDTAAADVIEESVNGGEGGGGNGEGGEGSVNIVFFFS